MVLYNGIDRDDLATIRSATGQDGSSVSCDPKLQAPTGTAATVDLHIQASPAVTQVEGNGVAISGLTDDFDGQTRSSLTPNDIGADAGNFTAFVNPTVGTNSPVCLDGPLNLTVSPNASMTSPTYAWTGNGTFTASASVQNPSVSTGLVAGSSDYTVTITDANGCVSISTASVVVNGLPTVGSSASANTICTGSQVTLNGSGAVSYTWDNGVTNNVAFTPSGTTTFTVTGTDANGCQNTSSETITLAALPSLGSLGQPAVCSGNIAAFNLTGLQPLGTFTVNFTINGVPQTPFIGLSSDASGDASFNSPVPLTSANNGQVLAITGLTRTDATPSCSNTFSSGNSVSLSVNPNPTLTAVTQTGNSCDGQFSTINLSGLLSNSLFSFDYSIGGVAQTPGFGGTAAGTSTSFPIAALLANDGQTIEITNITITSSSPNCSLSPSSNNTATLTVKPRPTAVFDANDFVCEGQTAPIDLNFTGTAPFNLQYSINGTPQTAVNTSSSPYSMPYTNATVSRTYAITAVTDANGCTAASLDAITIDVPIPCSITWNGSVSSDWNDNDNWTPNNSAPSNKTSVVLAPAPNSPNVSSAAPAANCANITFLPGAAPSIGAGFTLAVRGDMTGSTGNTISGDGKIVLNGTGTQNVYGRVQIGNVDFANTSLNGVLIQAGSSLEILPGSTATFLANSKLNNFGDFVLKSSASGTARIAAIPASTQIIGSTTIERWLPYGSGNGSWYLIGTPFDGSDFTGLSDDFRVCGPATGFGSQGGGILPANQPERYTVFTYNEGANNTRIDTAQKDGWAVPVNPNMVSGTGYRVYVNYYSNSLHKFDIKGAMNRNDYTFPTLSRTVNTVCVPSTYNCDLNLNGWNLLANPYPSAIDWDAASGWTKPSNMNNAFYSWNSVANGYVAYNGAAATNLGVTVNSGPNANVIPSSQGFFVKLLSGATGSLVVKESAKVTNTSGTYLRTATAESSAIRMRLKKEGQTDYQFDAMVKFEEGSSDAFDIHRDMDILSGPSYEFGFPNASGNLLLNSQAELSGETRIVPMHLDLKGQTGNFRFEVLSQSLPSGSVAYIRDNYLGELSEVSQNSVLSFIVLDEASAASDRFELIINPGVVTGNVQLSGQQISILPNPSKSLKGATLLMSGFSGKTAQVSICDMTGKVLFASSTSLVSGKAEISLPAGLASGVYQVKVKGENISQTRRFVVE